MFDEADWTRFDFWSTVAGQGLMAVELADRYRCREWLARNHYAVSTLDFGSGISAAVGSLDTLLSWHDQFGYSLAPDSRNLNAMRDGFLESSFVSQGRVVLELDGVERAWEEDPAWLTGFLSIAREASLVELALGRRFFCVILVKDDKSPVIGTALDAPTIGPPFRFSGR